MLPNSTCYKGHSEPSVTLVQVLHLNSSVFRLQPGLPTWCCRSGRLLWAGAQPLSTAARHRAWGPGAGRRLGRQQSCAGVEDDVPAEGTQPGAKQEKQVLARWCPAKPPPRDCWLCWELLLVSVLLCSPGSRWLLHTLGAGQAGPAHGATPDGNCMHTAVPCYSFVAQRQQILCG